MHTPLIHIIQQIHPLAICPERLHDLGPLEHSNRITQLPIDLIHLLNKPLKIPLPPVVCNLKTPPHANQHRRLVKDTRPQEPRLRNQQRGVLVEMLCAGGELVCAEHERHGGEGALRGEEVGHEAVDGGGARGRGCRGAAVAEGGGR